MRARSRSQSRRLFSDPLPSGEVTLSTQDIEITKRLREAGDIIGINVIDHIIFGANQYYSFVDEDLM
ncbi:MAG: hypothetical protein HN580_08910 [Deltaproteobacteria bacterium]|nr:hypothetical protein [Deltaproteobacteria bacterium]MBT4642434.1 hypothetical protein [Deltaproteobacteria bacterium]MBT6499075.1 hypothetical protein [Deltaproteobacteria bacterium]MBT6616540.1 hypothetical protein [Deltaproteobacteria bacterium]MBT7153561.1 hypothetical protein [Deltaproteobacteria bacterium]